MTFCEGFAPIEPSSAKVLILGTMPSVASLEAAFYYAHPRNAFWPIMAAILNVDEADLKTVEQKQAALKENGILLWDVLQACHRQGSLDSAIESPQANDFSALFKRHSELHSVFFNGKTAESLFKKHVLGQQSLPENLNLVTLPSTSPANARLKLDDKRLLWQEKLSKVL